MCKYLILVIFSSVFFASFFAHAQQTPNYISSNESRLFGLVSLMSNYVEDGLTQTQNNPAVEATVGYQFGPYARFGVNAHNVSYTNEDVQINFNPFASYKVLFSPNVDLQISYEIARYFKSSDRNGDIFLANLNLYTYHIIFKQVTDWEATDTTTSSYRFEKEWEFSNGLLAGVGGGINQVKASEFQSYNDLKGSIGYKYKSITYKAVLTTTTNTGQFNGEAGTKFFVAASAEF